jgi:hypothetical protein
LYIIKFYDAFFLGRRGNYLIKCGCFIDWIPKHALKCRPKGKRSVEHQRKRWKDELHLEGYRPALHLTLHI